MYMILEKLTLNNDKPAPYLWHHIHSVGSTPIDLFCNGPYLWGDEILEKFSAYGIWIGDTYGTDGITITDVFGADVDRDNTIFCITIEEFSQLSKVQATLLLTELRLMVCDYSEGGFLIREFMGKHNDSWESITDQVRQVIISHSGLDCFDHITRTWNTLNMHYFPLLTLWETRRTNNIPSLEQVRTPMEKRKGALIPVHKPRIHRVAMLSAMDKRGLLEDADWSLTVNFDEDGESGDFLKTPNVSVARFQDVAMSSFVGKHKHSIPRTLPNDTVKNFADCIPLDKQFAGQYKWYVSCETYNDLIFVTEKTYKGFIGGMPVALIGAQHTARQLTTDLEFEMPYYELYDDENIANHSDHNRYQRVCDIIQSYTVDQDIINYNFDLATNKDYLIATMMQRFIEF